MTNWTKHMIDDFLDHVKSISHAVMASIKAKVVRV